MSNEMLDPVGAHDRQRRIEAPLHQAHDLVERARSEHRIEPRVDAPRKLGPIGGEEQARPFVRRKRRRGAGAEERGERAPGRGQHL